MKVILTTRVANLGHPWEVKEVKKGYAMNFLFPQNLATPATPQLLKRAEKLQTERVKKMEEMKENAAEMAKKMKDLVLNFKQKAQGEKLYGSIAEKDVVDALLDQHKMELEKGMVKMKEHIKTLGEHSVKLHLAEGTDVEVKVVVEAEG
jgi:large subunit ribosomal protein L9